MNQILNTVALVLLWGTVIGTLWFVIVYWITSPWEKSPAGRHMMGSSVWILVVVAIALLVRTAEGEAKDTARAWGSVVTFGFLFWLMIDRWRLRMSRKHPLKSSFPTAERGAENNQLKEMQ